MSKRIPIICVVLGTFLCGQASAAERPDEAQKIRDELGRGTVRQNNGKVRQCLHGGTKRVSIFRRGGARVYAEDYLNCREDGSTRDGYFEVAVKDGVVVSRLAKPSINSELHDAVSGGDISRAAALIKKNADVNYAPDGWTPLMSAVRADNLAMVKLLVESGAWINYLNSSVGNSLSLAAANGNEEIVAYLIAHGAYLNNSNRNDVTPLMAAASNGHTSVVKKLVTASADINMTDRDGNSALMRALANGHTASAEQLIDSGADVTIANASGMTALLIAVETNNEIMTRKLIDRKAPLNVRSANGRSARDIALATGNDSIIRMIDPAFAGRTAAVAPSPPPPVPAPVIATLPPPAVAVKAAPPAPPDAAAAKAEEIPRFEIRRYLLEGNTLLAAARIEEILSRHTGTARDFGDIQQAMEQLEQAYRDRGYTMATVILPEQELTMGVVRLQSLEPRITAITIEGNNSFDRENILTSLPTLQTGVSPRVTAISENLRAANENPARKMSLQFKTQDNPEELHAALQVKDQKPWKINFSADNTGSAATGMYRAGLGFQYFNLFNRDHVAALQYTTSPDHAGSVKIVSGSYRLPLYRLGDTLDMFAAYSDVDSGTTQISGIDLTVSGKGVVSGFRYNMNLPRAGEYEQKLIGGMDYRLYDNSAVLLQTELAGDVAAHPLSLSYGGVWTTESLVVDGSLGVLYNIPGGYRGNQADFDAVRSGAVADYLILRYGLNVMLRPAGDWMVRVAANGQYTPDRLIPGEQFGYGGATVLRGYKEREESWDGGFSGSFEVYSPDMAGLLKISGSQLRLLGFFDGGIGYNLRPQAGELDSNSLRSVGAGFRLGIGEMFSFSMDWGYALDQSLQTRRGGNAVHFKGQLSY